MPHSFTSCPACASQLDAGYLSSPTGSMQWTSQAPGLLSRVLQTGDAVIDVSMPSLAYIHGWRCSKCGLILLSPQA